MRKMEMLVLGAGLLAAAAFQFPGPALAGSKSIILQKKGNEKGIILQKKGNEKGIIIHKKRSK